MYKTVFFLFALLAAVSTLPALNESFHGVKNKYYISKIGLEFFQAYAHCKIHGLSLATEINAEETLAVTEAIRAVGAPGNYFWLGGFYQNGGTFYPQWIWLDSGKPIEYNRWNSLAYQNPSLSYCFLRTPLVIAGQSLSGNWSLTPCTNKNTFICKTINYSI